MRRPYAAGRHSNRRNASGSELLHPEIVQIFKTNCCQTVNDKQEQGV